MYRPDEGSDEGSDDDEGSGGGEGDDEGSDEGSDEVMGRRRVINITPKPIERKEGVRGGGDWSVVGNVLMVVLVSSIGVALIFLYDHL